MNTKYKIAKTQFTICELGKVKKKNLLVKVSVMKDSSFTLLKINYSQNEAFLTFMGKIRFSSQ